MMSKYFTAKRVALALILLGALLLGVWGVQIGRTALSLREHLVQIQAWAEAPEKVEPAMACSVMKDIRDDVVTLQRRAGGLARLAPALGWLPRFGGDLRAAPHLLVVGDELTEAAAIGCEVAEPALESLGDEGASSDDFSPAQLVDLLAESQSELDRARAAVERAQRVWDQVDVEDLSPLLSGKAALLEKGLPLLQKGLSALMSAPDLLGANRPRTYLVLAMNEDELRPGGGHISGVGEVRVEAGQIISMTFRDGYAVDDFTQPYPDAPEPMRRYMGLDLWVFRDSNWSPDFPTAAQKAISLYRPGYPVSVDGVIALDQRAVQGLVGAVDPLTVEGHDDPVTGENILSYVHQAWAPGEEDWTREWWKERKSFMGPIAKAAWRQIEKGQVDWLSLARSVQRLLGEKHLLVYVPDPQIMEMLTEQGWGGALRSEDGDFLMVVDANLGYNKANAKIQQDIAYRVDLGSSPPQATLTLTYTHTSTVDQESRHESRYSPTYEGMVNRCYWHYMRVYASEGSELLDATRIPVPGEMLLRGEDYSGEVTVRSAKEGPWLTFGALGVLPTDSSQTRSFTWTLPADVVQGEGEERVYSLLVQKQPGTRAYPLTVRVQLPEGSTLLSTMPRPSAKMGEEIVYRTNLSRDREFVVRFRRDK